MKLLGFNVGGRSRELTTKAPVSPVAPADFTSPLSRGRGWTTIFESFPGAWQRNIELTRKDISSNHAVFACMTLIASDISKLGAPRFKRLGADGIWSEDESPAYDPVLREPNNFQTPNQFWENWLLSKLRTGNTYALKGRDGRGGVIRRLWILDPSLVTVLLSDGGDVFYQLDQDSLSGVRQTIVVPASEIIHDRMNCLFSPLIGLSPLYAAGLAASLGLNIIENASTFFANRSIPGGIITSPNTIPQETAERIKRDWEARYSQDGVDSMGRTAVMGDGLTFEPMRMTATDSQMLELARATAEWVCAVFHVPLYKIGAAPTPALANVEALNIEYYSNAIQKQLEDIEACLLTGLEMKPGTKVEFSTEGLMRMDTLSLITSLKDAVGASVMSPNEARSKIGLGPVPGGEFPLSQQQYFSLGAIAKRDAKDDPFSTKTAPAPAAEPEPEDEEDDDAGSDDEQATKAYADELAA